MAVLQAHIFFFSGAQLQAFIRGIVFHAPIFHTPHFFSSGKVMSPEKWGMKPAGSGHFKIYSGRSPDFIPQLS
jgi:hypothetical protein